MRIIAFDTATDDTVVGAADGDQLRFQSLIGPDPDGRPNHSSVLLESVEQAADSLGGWDRVDRIAVGRGPGTFTGLRIGLATATGIALSTGIELVGFPTLAALADGIGVGEGEVAIPLLDARRGEVFVACYDAAGDLLAGPTAVPPGDLAGILDPIGARKVAGGSGALRFRSELEFPGLELLPPDSDQNRLTPGSVCRAGRSVGIGPEKRDVEPLYLRQPDAERWIERDRG